MVLLSFSLIFSQFQCGVAYKSVAYEKSVYTGTFRNMKAFNKLFLDRSSRPEFLLEKAVLKIFEKIPGVHLQ